MKKTFLMLSMAVSILVLIAACSCRRTTETASQNTEPFPIIDMHMNTYQWNKYGDPPQPNLITGNVPKARTDYEALDAYLAEMDRHNIVMAVG